MFLYDLLILLVFVWLGRKLFQALKLPSLFGEVFAGIIAGPLVLGLVHETEAITVLAELGIFFLMFHSGLEFDPKDIFKASKRALLVATGNVVFSMAGGMLVGFLFDFDFQTSFFLGMVLSITAVAVSARIFKDNKIIQTEVAHTVMAAAVMTEVFILIIFSIFLDISQTGTLDGFQLFIDMLKFISYFGLVFYIGHKYFKQLYRVIYKGNKGFTFSIILALALAVSAELIGLHFIIGAFLAGLFLHSEMFDDKVFKKIEDRSFGISYSFLAPVFFASLAFHLDFSAFETIPLVMVALLIIDIIAKFFGTGLAAWWSGMKKIESISVGVAMSTRGAVDLIIATIALEAGVINVEIFSMIILVAFAATLFSTLGIKKLAPKLKQQISD
jgi:Kef-type K+ transport system membrane component KefB